MKKINLLLCFLAILLAPRFASAFVVGPYTADASTVFLFHLDEAAAATTAVNASGTLAFGTNAVTFHQTLGVTNTCPSDTTILGAGGASGFAYFAGGSFGNAAVITNAAGFSSTAGTISNGLGVDFNVDGNYNYYSNSLSAANAGDGLTNHNLIVGANYSFTLEALVNLPDTNSANREIICSDNQSGIRGFQFRITQGNLEFNFINGVVAGDILVRIPVSGPNAFVPNQWFHVAVTHIQTPTPGGTNTILYWTALSDSSKVANAIFTNTAAAINTNAPMPLVIGNEGRLTGGSSEGLRGYIDEVRISNTKRAANQMMFLNDITITLQPVSKVVAVGGTTTFTVAATTDFPTLSYQWRSNGVAIGEGGDFTGTQTPTLQIANAVAGYAATYDCLITNSRTPTPDSTTTIAGITLTVHTGLNLLWRGTVNSNWDNAAATNWFNTANSSPTNFFTGDNVKFDDSGTGNPVNIPNSVQPGSVNVNSANAYTFSGNGKITGVTGLTKTNSGTLTIATTNDYSGVTYLGGGTVSVAQLANSLSASAIGAAAGASSNLVLDGGTLQYTGPTASNDHGATLNAGGGTVDVTNAATTLTLGGVIVGTSGGGLTKIGNGTLALGGANSYNGGTLISAGTLQLSGSGTFGTGNVTNNSALLFSGTIAVTNNVSGSGSLTNDATGTLTLSGNNSYSGATTINGPNFGGLIVGSSGALSNTPQVTVVSTTGGANGGTRVTLNAGVSTPAGTTLSLPTASTTIRSDLFSAGAGSWNGPITIVGDGAVSPGDQVAFHGSGGFLTVNGNITSSSFDGGTLQLRGDGTGAGSASNVVNGAGGAINGTISLGAGTLQVNDGAVWTINSTGNTWGNSQIAKGTLRIGANNALPTGTTVRFSETPGNAILDLNGFNQTVAGFNVFNTATALAMITNGSATSDSTLTFGGGFATYGGLIADGSRKMSLTVSSGTLILTNANSYTGDTLVTAGTLALGVSGSISNSANINVSSGAFFDVSTRNDTMLTISAGQTLKGSGDVSGATAVIVNGTVSPGNSSIATLTIDNGDLTLQPGSLTSVDINKTANTSDQIACSSGNITYGGILAVANLSGTLVNGDSFTLFTGTSLPGNFSGISGSPGAGLAYSFANGVLSVVTGGPATNPTNITVSVSGGTLTLSWPSDHLGWILQAQTNSLATGLNTNSSAWFDVPLSDASTQSVISIRPSNPSVFYRLRLP